MATKKQKRERAEAKHKAYMEDLRLSGLAAQKKDHEDRAREHRKNWQERHDESHSFRSPHPHCPLCADRSAKKSKQEKK